MNTAEVAQRLVELCRKHDYETAQKELYADDAVSLEPEGSPSPNAKGREAIIAKGRAFLATIEIHGGTVSEPVVADPFFSIALIMDVTKGGARFTIEEVCVYEVKAGKIVREQFFYGLE